MHLEEQIPIFKINLSTVANEVYSMCNNKSMLKTADCYSQRGTKQNNRPSSISRLCLEAEHRHKALAKYQNYNRDANLDIARDANIYFVTG